ncbi:MAG: imidazolonepropionase [Melioribacteraceae bacterium]|nr:MAG: imidazolonepropionase [Melioribacteraceae bacterium]
MKKLIYNPAQILTINTNGNNLKRGKEQSDVGLLENHSIEIENGRIKDFIRTGEAKKESYDEVIDVSNKVILPGLVECHTHTTFAGSRADEFRMKLEGIDYEEIAKKGGGIISTVKAVRQSSFDELVNIAKPRVEYFIEQGITTLEIKSGYGLSFFDEIKLLQVIQHLNKIFPIDIVATFLGAHTFPPEYKKDRKKYIEIICDEMIPYVAENKLAEFCDVFCESTAFSAKEVDRIFNAASKHKLKLKLHTEQFNNIGGLETAIKHKAISVDHLEVLKLEQIESLKKSKTIAVLLPGVSFFLNYDYAPARELIKNKIPIALATDYNPGSSHIANLNFIMSLAALKMKLSIEEVITSVTINSAAALSKSKSVGSLEIGKRADFSVFDTNNYADIVYQVGKNICEMTIKDGEVIYKK